MPPAPRIRPYKDFLTPALHRRFATATVTLSALCYVEAVLIGEFNSLFWTWFPFGRAGIRTGLLFIPAFMIFILRVAQLHVGLRTSNSPWQTFTKYAVRFESIQTTGWYILSAYLFSEIYIWSASKDADLNRIKLIARTDRPTLNERPIYLTCHFILLAIVQAGCHLFYDYDRIDIPVIKTEGSIAPPFPQVKSKFFELVQTSMIRSAILAVTSPFIYSLTVRNLAWSFTRFWARIFWNLPKSGALPSIRPFHWGVLLRSFSAGLLLILLWEMGNLLFSVYVAQEPLKNERPITFESKDPNGSLLTGLKGKKLQTRAFAFWELLYIAERFQGRRKNIFEDIDRKGGSAWSQVLESCMSVITGIDQRIADYKTPAVPSTQPVSVEEIPSLPKISKPIKTGDIFDTPTKSSSTTENLMYGIGSLAKNFGQSPPRNSPDARKLLEKAESIVLTKQQQEAGISGFFKEKALLLLTHEIGKPFRQEYRRRIASIVLGLPYGDVGIIVDAINALTRFCVTSLEEDKYGNVQRDVKTIIQRLTITTTTLENFKNTLGFHWTDVEKKQESPEVDTILAALKNSLNELISSFGNYSEDLRLSQNDMRMARAAATPLRRREMQQAGR